LRFGTSLSWTEGQRQTGNDDQVRLDGTRIPPLKITAHGEQQTLSWWHNRLQAQYVGDRHQFPDASEPWTFGDRGLSGT